LPPSLPLSGAERLTAVVLASSALLSSPAGEPDAPAG